MRAEYDFSKAKKNPYAKRLKQRVTIRLDHPTVEYFKGLSEETGIPYQTLINLYLRDGEESKREWIREWRPEVSSEREVVGLFALSCGLEVGASTTTGAHRLTRETSGGV